ncbi:hypothetical protein Tsubulata_049091, partial [Turnera subulata]
NLQPHQNVEEITIERYGGASFAWWMGEYSRFTRIVKMTIKDCKNCVTLPPVGQLQSLKHLSIEGFDSLKRVGEEFYGRRSATTHGEPFPWLQVLKIKRMPVWGEWVSGNKGAFPRLQRLQLVDCPMLSKALPTHLPSLSKLDIHGCGLLFGCALPESTNIRKLELSNESRASRVRRLSSGMYSMEVEGDGFLSIESLFLLLSPTGCVPTSLKRIENKGWESLTCLQLELFPDIKILEVEGCPRLQKIEYYKNPQEEEEDAVLVSLETLRLENCSELESLPQRMSTLLLSLKVLEIIDCPQLESFGGVLPRRLETLHVRGSSKKLTASRMEWDVQSLSSLSFLWIESCEDAVSFPEHDLLPSSLTKLYQGLPPSLSQLFLTTNCPSLEALISSPPLPSALQALGIWNCIGLFAHRMNWNLHSLPCLSTFHIGGCDDAQFPPDNLLLSTITILGIHNLPRLENLNYTALQQLPSLTTLSLTMHNAICSKVYATNGCLPPSAVLKEETSMK